MKKILYIIGIAAVLASCSKGLDQGNGSDDRTPIEFDSSIKASTRAIANNAMQFSESDKIGIIGCIADIAGQTTDFSSPLLNGVEFNYGSNKFTPTTANTAAYWQFGKVHNFYAYYPSTLAIKAGGNGVDPTSTLSVVAGETGIAHDVMHAKVENLEKFTGAAGTAGNTALLNFEHKLSKVRFRVLKENTSDADPVLNKVEFTMAHDAGIYNVATGAVTHGTTASAVTLSKTMNQTVSTTDAKDVDAEWTVLPADKLSGIKLTIGTRVLTATITGGAITTAVGRITVITLTIKPSGVVFTSATLEDWGNDVGYGEAGSVAAIGKYYYSDGSFSDDYKVPSDGVTLLGVAYAVNGTNGMLVEVTEGTAGVWGPNNVTTNASSTADGQANMTTIKKIPNWATNYPGFKRCADKNAGDATDWYLPAMEELTELFVAYNTYGSSAFNALMTAASDGVEFTSAPYYSSSEYGVADGWVVNFGLGFTNSYGKGYNNRFRCVRKF